MAYWLIKSEPYKYSWDQFQQDGRTFWDGVRNYAARLNLRAMRKGDEAFFYHSNEGKEIVGIAMVITEAYQDPTTTEDWSVVDFAPVRPMTNPVSLARIKSDPGLQNMALLRLSRLSVQPVTPEEWNHILLVSETPCLF
jgi:predicted RNA-binding protein with PUA-like domain